MFKMKAISIEATVGGVFAALLLLCGPSFTQTVQGSYPLQAGTGGQYDTLSLGDLGVSLHLPIRAKAGMIPFSFDSVQQTRLIWSSGTPRTIQLVGNTLTGSPQGLAGAYVTFTAKNCGGGAYVYTAFGLGFVDGSSHSLNYYNPVLSGVLELSNGISGSCGSYPTNSASSALISLDGIPYTVYVNTAPGTVYAQITDASGSYAVVRFNTNLSTATQYVLTGSGTVTDTHGNTLSQNGGTTTNYVDSLAQTALTVVGTANPNTNFCWDPSTQPVCVNAPVFSYLPTKFSYTLADGSTVSNTTVAYTTFNFATAFVCTQIGADATGTQSVSLPTTVTLPDGSKLLLGYESTPGYGAGYSTGRLAKITLPTGGVISYAYSGGKNGINCNDLSSAVVTRTTSDGSWVYTHGWNLINGQQVPVTYVVDPNGNQTYYTFQTDLVTGQRYVLTAARYAGASTLLSLTTNCYWPITPNETVAEALGSCPYQFNRGGITSNAQVNGEVVSYTQIYNGTQSKVSETDKIYSIMMLPLSTTVYDFGTASASPTTVGPILSTHYVSYGTYSGGTCTALGNGIYKRVCKAYANDGAGVLLDQTTFAYDPLGALLSEGVYSSSGTALTTTFTNNTNGTVATTKDPNGTITTYAPGACNGAFPTSVAVGGLTTSMTWDCNSSRVIASTDPNNNRITVDYTANGADPFYRAKGVVDQLGNETYYYYHSPTTDESVLSFGSSVSESYTTSDLYGRQIVIQNQTGPSASTYDTKSYQLDSMGRPSTSTMPCTTAVSTACTTKTSSQTYDALSRPLVSTDGGGGTTTDSYIYNDMLSVLGPATSSVDHVKQKQYEYNALGQLMSVCEITAASGSRACGQANGGTGFLTSNVYDGARLVSITQGAQVRSFTYDLLGRILTGTDPESGTTRYTYDSSSACGTTYPGDLVSKVDANGNTTCYQYDGLHRLLVAASGSTCRRFFYDASAGATGTIPNGVSVANNLGRMVEAETDNCSVPIVPITDEWFAYDKRGLVTTQWESTPHSNGYYESSVSYYANSVVSSLSGIPNYPTIVYNLDGEGRQASATQGVSLSLVSGTTFNAAGQPKVVTIGSAADNDTYTYDPNTGRMASYTFTVGATPITMMGSVNWNTNGTLGSLAITDGFNAGGTQTCAFGTSTVQGYDDEARLLSDNCGSVWAQTFSYDQYGNLTKAGSHTWNPGYNPANNRFTLAGTSYDSDGNLLQDTFNTFQYDAFGKAITMQASPNSPAVCGSSGTCLTYDAFGRVIEKNVSGVFSQILYSPIGKTAVMKAQVTQSEYVPLPGGATGYITGSTGQNRYFQHKDWLGSARLESSVIGRAKIFDLAFAPFGELYQAFGATTLNFTGDTQDTFAGLFDTLTRELNPNEGRWNTPDTQWGNPASPQTLNRYAYVIGSPLVAIDPDGLDCVYLEQGASAGGAPYVKPGDCISENDNGFYFDGTVYGGSAAVDINGDVLALVIGSGVQCSGECPLDSVTVYGGSASQVDTLFPQLNFSNPRPIPSQVPTVSAWRPPTPSQIRSAIETECIIESLNANNSSGAPTPAVDGSINSNSAGRNQAVLQQTNAQWPGPPKATNLVSMNPEGTKDAQFAEGIGAPPPPFFVYAAKQNCLHNLGVK
jgi:RHS repeat-associated protein